MIRSYLKGLRFTIRTDRDSSKWILNLAACCRLGLFFFYFNMVHRVEIRHQAFDALSILQTIVVETETIEDDLSVAVINIDRTDATIQRLENYHLALAQVVEKNIALKDGATPTISEFLQHYTTDRSSRKAALSVETAIPSI